MSHLGLNLDNDAHPSAQQKFNQLSASHLIIWMLDWTLAPQSFSLYGESWCLGSLCNLSTSVLVSNPLFGLPAGRHTASDL